MKYEKATVPTMYFIGVTTGQSSIMKVFPKWAKALGIQAQMVGIDLPIHADPEAYRECVSFIRQDPLSLGALVTTHKIDLFEAASSLFDYLDPYGEAFGELSSISKNKGRLEGYAKDPISSGLAMEEFLPKHFFQKHRGNAVIFGAGGSALAIASYLSGKARGEDLPSKIFLTNRSEQRLITARKHLEALSLPVPVEYVLCPTPAENEAVLKQAGEYAFVVNATGLGKDRPGSPLPGDVLFSKHSIVWELNYRGSLEFLVRAKAQKKERDLQTEDGWEYFIHGWTQVIAEVFHHPIVGEELQQCKEIAKEMHP